MTDTPASLRAELRTWAKGKSLTVQCHADVVAANLKLMENGMPSDPVIRITIRDNIKRLAKVAAR